MSFCSNLKNILNRDSEYKTLLSNFSYLMILQVVGYIFPLITLPYLSRVIGTNGFGKIAFAAAIISWIQTFADWGFNFTATRDVAQNRNDRQKVSEIFSNVLWARVLLTFVSFLILLLLLIIVPSFKENAVIILLTFLMIPGHVFFPDWFFQAIEKMRYIVILNILIKVIFTVLVFIVIRSEEDFLYQPLFTSVGYVISGIISLYIIIKKYGYCILKPNFNSIIATIKQSSAVFVNNLAPNLYNSFSVILLSSVCGSSANGIFDGGNKIISIAYQFILVISRTFFPFLSRRKDKHNIYVKINLLTGVFCSLVLFFAAPIVINLLLSPEFSDSIIVLRILAISMIFMVLSNTYGTNYLIIVHRDKELRNITIICSVIGLLLAYPLVSLYSYLGAALTVLVSRFLLGTTTYLYAKKVSKQIGS